MGTVPNNFPPDASMEIGQSLVGSSIGNTAALATTTFFTAPTSGLYLVSAAVRITQTDGAGTLTLTVTLPTQTVVETTIANGTKQSAILKDADPSGPSNGFMAAIPVWLNAAQTVRCGVAVSGLTGTTYNVYTTATRLF